MIEGDLYPHLRHASVEHCNVILRKTLCAPLDRFEKTTRYQVDQQAVAGIKITMPESDWQAIMEIYRAHWHAENRNPSVRAAWEQYKIMCSLTR